jgi:UDP-N-acetylmuramoyl-tripeptide--D-alanyl-D-alanine ligase
LNLDILQVAEWTSGILSRVEQYHRPGSDPLDTAADPTIVTGYSIDSRTLNPGDIFFAVKGDRFDGHDFVAGAFERGAVAAVVTASRAPDLLPITGERTLILVDDPLTALQTLALTVRRRWNKRVVAVTGSAGKTTTKEAIAAILGMRFRVLKSLGNLNNAFGLPLQLLKLHHEHDIAVIEMGMSHAGEIAVLAKIAAPDWGVVTNVGSAHQENFPEGMAGIARAKFELIESLTPSGMAFLNCDDAYVSQFGRDILGRAVYFGTGPCANPRADQIEELGAEGVRFRVVADNEEAIVTLALLGRHNVINACAAIAVGLQAGVTLPQCVEALARLQPPDKRGEILCIRSATLINDSYNSNPEALKSMIRTLASMPRRRKILVAGEMLELGPNAVQLHRECGKAAADAGIDIVVGVRGNAIHIVEAAAAAGVQTHFFERPQLAGAWLADNLHAADAVLLKASRGVRLEQVLESLPTPLKDVPGPAPYPVD